MKRTLFFVALMVISIMFTVDATGQKSVFSGTWKLDRTNSLIPEYTPILTRLTVKIAGDSLLTERFYDIGDGQEYPFTENIKLNGKEFNITIYDMPRKTKANWSDQNNSVNLESTITFYGSAGAEDFFSKETWNFDKSSNTLKISFKNKSSQGEADGQFLLNKQTP